MPSHAWNTVTGVVAVALLAYSVVIAGNVFAGVVGVLVVVLSSLTLHAVVGDADGYPSELGRTGTLVGLFLSVLVVGYSVLVAGEILLGVLAVPLVFGCLWAVAYVHSHGYPASLGRTRTLATGLAIAVTLLYSVLVAGSLLLGIIVGLLIGLTAWLTSPTGPLLAD